jgi:hypothetical protein
MQNKFEQLLDYLVNEETDKANELFHQIVVEKSRGIYENLISEEEKEESEKNKEVKEDDLEENFGEEQVIEIGGDPTDDMMGDVEFGDEEGDEGEEDEMGAEFGDEEGGHDEEQDDRIDDLEAALDDLKAEFEKLMGGDDEMDDMGGEMDDMGDMGDEEEDESFIREYTENVGKPYGGGKVASSSESGADNKKSIVAKPNKMGGTAFKLGAGGEEKGGTQGGLLNPSPKEDNAGNVNVKGGTNAKQFFKKDSSGHGTEKKGSGEEGGVYTKSPLSPSHNK